MNNLKQWETKYILLSALTLLISACGGGSTDADADLGPPPGFVELSDTAAQYTRQQVLDAAIDKYFRYAETRSPSAGYPIADDGQSQRWGQSSLRWSSGFFPGILWQLSYFSGNDNHQELARKWTLPLAQTATWSVHDVGFLIDLTFGMAYRITSDTEFLPTWQTAAQTLSSRYNERVGATRSWDRPNDFVVIIDNMMNLPLLFNVSAESGNEAYFRQASSHMQTTAREFVRSNGSSFHVVDFNESDGSVVRKRTAQGYADNSTWARGQAWGIYGFAMAYRYTGDVLALEQATNMANYFLSRLPEDNVPPWDFDAQGSAEPKDTSASAIAASGMWVLGALLGGEQGEAFKKQSVELVDALLNDTYLSISTSTDAMLRRATGNNPGNFEVEVSLIYADYYLIEAILLQQEIIDFPL